MRPRPVEIVLCLQTRATIKDMRVRIRQMLRDELVRCGDRGKIIRADVFLVKRLKAGTPEGGRA